MKNFIPPLINSYSFQGNMCFTREQIALYFTADVYLLVNTGREIIHSDHNMLSTVAFQLGPKSPVFYALEGLLPGSGSCIEWLNELTTNSTECDTQNRLQLLTMLNNSSQHSDSIYCSPNSPASTLCGTPPQLPAPLPLLDQVGLSTSSTTGQYKTAPIYATRNNNLRAKGGTSGRRNIFFVPARDKLLLPGCTDPRGHCLSGDRGSNSRTADPTRGLIYGVTKDTTSSDLVQAAFEGISFQVKQLLRALQEDCKSWHPLRKVTVGGELMERSATHLAQTLADFCNVTVEYPQTEAVSAFGAFIAAGLALNLLTLESIRESMVPPTTVYQRSLRLTETEGKYRRWEALQLAIWEVSDGEHSDPDEDSEAEEGDNGLDVNRKRLVTVGGVPGAVAVEERYKDPLYNVQRSIPGTVFATVAFGMLLVADWLL